MKISLHVAVTRSPRQVPLPKGPVRRCAGGWCLRACCRAPAMPMSCFCHAWCLGWPALAADLNERQASAIRDGSGWPHRLTSHRRARWMDQRHRAAGRAAATRRAWASRRARQHRQGRTRGRHRTGSEASGGTITASRRSLRGASVAAGGTRAEEDFGDHNSKGTIPVPAVNARLALRAACLAARVFFMDGIRCILC
jgi:hypothetical protein